MCDVCDLLCKRDKPKDPFAELLPLRSTGYQFVFDQDRAEVTSRGVVVVSTVLQF